MVAVCKVFEWFDTIVELGVEAALGNMMDPYFLGSSFEVDSVGCICEIIYVDIVKWHTKRFRQIFWE